MNNNVTESETSGGVATAVAPEPAFPTEAASDVRGYVARSLAQLRTGAWPTLKYLAETEVHTYAFSVAACAVLSFIPAVVMMGTIIRLVFHSDPMYQAMLGPTGMVDRYLPTWKTDDLLFILRHLRLMVRERHSIEIMSLVMLLISATGVFEPLEVALNKVWGFKGNRNYLMNQVVSLGLAFGCSALALGSVALTSNLQNKATTLLPHDRTQVARPAERFDRSKKQASQSSDNQQQQPQAPQSGKPALLNRLASGVHSGVNWLIIKCCGLLTTIAMFFLIYWLLPNGKVNPWDVLPAAAVTGVLLEIARYIYILVALPLLDFHEAYGPFSVSVTLIFWSFTAGLLLLGGAHLSAYGKTQEQ